VGGEPGWFELDTLGQGVEAGTVSVCN